MEWKDVGSKIADAAPLLGSLFGPVGTGIGTGIKLLASAFGLKESDVTPDKINSLLATDPQAALKLAEIEANNRIELQKLVIETDRMYLGDRADARDMHVKTTQTTGKRDINMYVLAWVIIGGFIGLIGGLIAIQLVTNKTLQADPLLTLLLGSLSTDAGMVVGYFFGSSKSSTDKTALLTNAGK